MRASLTGLLIAAGVVVTPAHGTVVFPGMDTVARFLQCQSRAVNDLDDGKLPIAIVAKHVAARCQSVHAKMETTLVRLNGVGWGHNDDLALRAVELERRTKFDAKQLIGTPPELKRTVGCMLRVLKVMPDVEGAVWHPGVGDGVHQPFLEYHFRGQLIRFQLDGSPGHYTFTVVLSGLFGARGPNDFGTGEVQRKWRAQCGADAGTFFP